MGYLNRDPISPKKGFSIFSDLVFGHLKYFYTNHVQKRLPKEPGNIDRGVTCNANVPLEVSPGRVEGVLAVGNLFTHRSLTPRDVRSLFNFATTVGMALESVRLHEENRRFAVTDELTGVFNRRYFDRRLSDEVGRCRRTGRPCHLLILEVDHFKSIHDTFGHPVGDEVLKFTASALQRRLREVDTLARIGGEEFGVILPEIGSEEALAVARRLVEGTAAEELPVPDLARVGRRVAVSAGIAAFPEGANGPEGLLKMADASLYAAKREGRNRVGPLRRLEPRPEGG